MNILKRFSQWVLQRRYPAVPVALGLLLAIPSLWVGLLFDDYGIRATVLDQFVVEGISTNPWQPFSFLDGDPARNQKLMDYGFLPWWSDLECRAAFMRPLTAATHIIDYRFLDAYPMLMHAQSLVWFALLIWAAALLYRRLMGQTMPPWFAALAAVLFAIDDARAGPVGWLANRNTLLAGLFGILALVAYDRWRRERWRPGAVLAPLLLLAGLLSKESAVCAAAYLLAYAIFLDRGSWPKRLAGLIPCMLVGFGWYAVYKLTGYGTEHSGVYIDPGHDPIGFARGVIRDGPILFLGQWGLPPSQLSLWCSASALRLLWLGSLVFVVAWSVLFVPLVARNRLARFWATGMLLSILPACAAFADDRLLLFVGLGGMGLLAQFLGGLEEGAPWLPASIAWRRLARIGSFSLIAVHLVIAPLLFSLAAVGMKLIDRRPLALGDVIELPTVTITITDQTEDGRAAEATFRFRVPLEDPSLRWVTLTAEGHVAFEPPKIGEKAEVPMPLVDAGKR